MGWHIPKPLHTSSELSRLVLGGPCDDRGGPPRGSHLPGVVGRTIPLVLNLYIFL